MMRKYAFIVFNVLVIGVSDGKEYALKLIEGTGISMSACREIAVSVIVVRHTAVTVLSI